MASSIFEILSLNLSYRHGLKLKCLKCVMKKSRFLNQWISRPDRLRAIADRFNLDQNAVLDNVLYARAYTSKNLIENSEKIRCDKYFMQICNKIFYDKLHLSGEHQYELMDFVAAKFYEESGVFKLLVS